MRPTQNGALHEKTFCFGIRASRQSKLINACSFHARPQHRRRKDDFAEGEREAAGAPNPDGHAVQFHVIGGSIRHGHEIANCCSPLLEDRNSGLHKLRPMSPRFVQCGRLIPRSRHDTTTAPSTHNPCRKADDNHTAGNPTMSRPFPAARSESRRGVAHIQPARALAKTAPIR